MYGADNKLVRVAVVWSVVVGEALFLWRTGDLCQDRLYAV